MLGNKYEYFLQLGLEFWWVAIFFFVG